jgi:hypothetical protein
VRLVRDLAKGQKPGSFSVDLALKALQKGTSK